MKIKLRRIYFLFLVLAMTLGVAAAARAEVDVSTIEKWGEHIKSIHGGKELNLLVGVHPSTDAMRRYYHEFEELTGINVNFRIITDGTVRNVALLEMTGRTGNFDVIAINAGPLIEFGGLGLVRDLGPFLNDPVLTPEWFDYDDIIPAFSRTFATSQGNIVGIPIAGESRFLGYRTDLFEEHGKEPPRTMDELLELARYFNDIEPDLYGISMRAASGAQAGSGYSSVAFAFTDSPFANNFTGEPEFDHPDTVVAIQYFVDLLKNAPPDVTTYSHEEALNAFMQGRTAMWLDASALVGRIMDPSQSVISDKVDFLPTPDGPKGKCGTLAGWSFIISNDAVDPELSWAWIVYMASRATSLQYHENGGVPSRTSILTNPALVAQDPTFPSQHESLERTLGMVTERGLTPIPDFWWVNDFTGVAGTYVSLVMIGQLTAEEAARQGQLEMLEYMEDNVR